MNNKEKKQLKSNLAIQNINKIINLLDARFYPQYDNLYIKQIKDISESFNIRLQKEQKLKFCKKCNTYMNPKTREIRLNKTTKTKDYICKICGYARKFKYK